MGEEAKSYKVPESYTRKQTRFLMFVSSTLVFCITGVFVCTVGGSFNAAAILSIWSITNAFVLYDSWYNPKPDKK